VCSSVFDRAFDRLTDNVTGHKLITCEPQRFSFTRFAELRIEITTVRQIGMRCGRGIRKLFPPTARAILSKCNSADVIRPIRPNRFVPSNADSSSDNDDTSLAAFPSRERNSRENGRAKGCVYIKRLSYLSIVASSSLVVPGKLIIRQFALPDLR